MQVHAGAWVLPVATAPVRGGWVAVENGRIVSVGGPGEPRGGSASRHPHEDDAEASARAILPGLVNAHAHLELSWMKGQVGAHPSMPAWASELMTLRRATSIDALPAIRAAIGEAHASGTCLIGDVANTVAAYAPLAESDVSAMMFLELIGFTVDAPEPRIREAQTVLDALPLAPRVRSSVVPHAPYSVSPQLIAALGAHAGTRPFAIHLAESAAEIEFLRAGRGPWRDLLGAVGAWNPSWVAPGCGPVEYLARLGVLGPGLVAVHGVHLADAELARLAGAGATLVTCPRSNEWTGAGIPPIERFYASGVRVAIGTDSLASVATLSMFHEMAAVRRLAPAVPARRILESATRNGARALGFDDLGAIVPGRRAALLSVRIPPDLDDVEEYLVSGVEAADVRWIGADEP